jgi:SAM-dependent methyltransferase
MLARFPRVVGMMERMNFLTEAQREFILFARKNDIRWADACKAIPEREATADVVYSSHMLEHLYLQDAVAYLREARRVLKEGATIRLAVPNLSYHVQTYVRDGDANQFVVGMGLARERPKSFLEIARYFVIGDRGHKWMYDGRSLCALLTAVGFKDAIEIAPGETMIPDPGDLDLRERCPESLFVEAVNP